jgi:hypothetical protein
MTIDYLRIFILSLHVADGGIQPASRWVSRQRGKETEK